MTDIVSNMEFSETVEVDTAPQKLEVTDDEWLLRLNFNPEHIQSGQVIPSAVNLTDLKSRGFSIDREVLAEVVTIRRLADEQQQKKPEERQAPYLSRFLCKPVRQETDDENQAAFLIEASPLETNKAHAHILSAKKLGDGGLRKLRNKLLPHLQNLISLEDYVAQ